MTHARRAGLYVIVNTITNSRYFGSAQRLGVRRQRHFRDLRAGEHVNPHLQAAWNKYGEAAFAFAVLAVLEVPELRAAEQRLLDKHYGRENCYNVSRDASAPMAGRKLSAESRAKVSAAIRGVIRSPETRARMSAAQARRGADPRSMAAMWAATRGKSQSAEHVAKRVAAVSGRKHSPERVAQRTATRTANRLAKQGVA